MRLVYRIEVKITRQPEIVRRDPDRLHMLITSKMISLILCLMTDL